MLWEFGQIYSLDFLVLIDWNWPLMKWNWSLMVIEVWWLQCFPYYIFKNEFKKVQDCMHVKNGWFEAIDRQHALVLPVGLRIYGNGMCKVWKRRVVLWREWAGNVFFDVLVTWHILRCLYVANWNCDKLHTMLTHLNVGRMHVYLTLYCTALFKAW